jgi:hypothetical protein
MYMTEIPKKQAAYGTTWMMAAVQKRLESEASQENPLTEFNDYIKGPLTKDVEDIVAWWGVSNSSAVLPHFVVDQEVVQDSFPAVSGVGQNGS